MAWEAIAAVGSVASAVILLIGAVAAVVQIKHLRVANQLGCYLHLMGELNSRELVEARRFVWATDFNDPATLRATIQPELDDRVRMLGTHLQGVARLLNLGIVDERMFAAHLSLMPLFWKATRPVYRALRTRTGTPLMVDVEYLVYGIARKRSLAKVMARYPKAFLESSGLEPMAERMQEGAEEAIA